MRFSEALKKWEPKDQAVKNLWSAKQACQIAGLDEAEQIALLALTQRLKELTGKPVVLGC